MDGSDRIRPFPRDGLWLSELNRNANCLSSVYPNAGIASEGFQSPWFDAVTLIDGRMPTDPNASSIMQQTLPACSR